MASIEKILSVWKPFKVGQKIKVKAKYRKGEFGIIKERLDDSVNGMGRYGVVLNSSPSLTTDFCRHELTKAEGK